MEKDATLYNQITVKNIDNEDFTFNVDREQYMIRKGEVRKFPKFMVRPMLKHLIDKILIKKDKDGKLLRVQKERDALAARIVLKEEIYQRPQRPTDRQLVDKMNRDEPELDKILKKNKTKLKKEEVKLIPVPKVDTKKIQTPKPKVVVRESKSVKQVAPKSKEKFDQIEEEKNRELPTREKMLKYAKNTLKLDVTETKTKKAWDAMSDKQLYKEFGLDQESDLKAIGL